MARHFTERANQNQLWLAIVATQLLALILNSAHTFWHFIMHGGSVGCEITGRRTLDGCEITGRRTLGKGGRINEGGRIHDTNSFDVEK